MSKGNTKYEERYVAFMDILGFKDLVNDERKVSTLRTLFECTSMFTPIVQKAQKEGYSLIGELALANTTLISDSIVISVPANDPRNVNLGIVNK